MNITDIILKENALTQNELTELTNESEHHPYFHAALLTLASALCSTNETVYDDILRRTAISVPNRRQLFFKTQGYSHKMGASQPGHSDSDEKREPDTSDYDASLVNQSPDTQPESKPRRPVIADATTDYMSYLLQSETTQQTDSNATEQPMRGQSLIDDFIDNNAYGERIVLKDNDDNAPEPYSQTIEPDDELPLEYFTETMAHIYIKQGKFDKAIKIITRLNAEYPEKNRYFADQMRFLQKLALNQAASKG